MRAALVLLLVSLTSACGTTQLLGPSIGAKPVSLENLLPPPDAPLTLEDGEVIVSYLGVGGLYIEWQGHAILSPPYYTGQLGLLGHLRMHEGAIEAGLKDWGGRDRLSRVATVLLGHAHFDHISDLPYLARKHIPNAKLWVNRSASYMLQAAELPQRPGILESRALRWVNLHAASEARPFARFMPLPSTHLPQFGRFSFADDEVKTPWSAPWGGQLLTSMRHGAVHAFLIELLAPDGPLEPVFRIYFQGHVERPHAPETAADPQHPPRRPWRRSRHPLSDQRAQRAGQAQQLSTNALARPAPAPRDARALGELLLPLRAKPRRRGAAPPEDRGDAR